MKKIIFIPPSGVMVQQDFILSRMLNYLKNKEVETYLLQINSNSNVKGQLVADNIINVENETELIQYLNQNKFDLIFHRAWMHRYKFAASLTKKFNNIVVYIKDWHDGTRKEQYSFVYKTDCDYEGIEELFSSNCIILSHFTKKQINIWEKEYHITKKNFMFFPEYCNDSLFINNNMGFCKNSVKLVYAGGIPYTSYPEDIVPAKQLFKMMKTISQVSQISTDILLLPKFYNNLLNERNLYQDYLFENEFNDNFNIRIGKELDHSLLQEYNFGLFADAYIKDESLYNMFYKYAVTSKLAFYLEAGLPILINKKSKALSKIVRKYHIGLIYQDKDLKNLQNIVNIDKNKYKKLVENVYKFRKTFSYNDITMKPIMDIIYE